ncbi:MAG: SelL-related redox protein [Tepidiformaceae bacterium]
MVPKALVDRPAPAFSAPSPDGHQRSLSDYRGHNLLLVFNRHLESRPCRDHARALWRYRELLAALDTEVLVVSFESMERIGWYLTDADSPWPVVSDPRRRIYHAYGLGRAGVASDWFSPRTATGLVSRVFQGSGERFHADAHQTGGDFLIDADGILRYAYRCRGSIDRPPVDELLLELRRLPAA